MPRKKRVVKTRLELTDGQIAWLHGNDDDPEFRFFTAPDELADLWRQHSPMVLKAWISEHPGSRPQHWWTYSAPRVRIKARAGEFEVPLPRERLGGVGTPTYEVLNDAPEFRCGIPCRWVDEWQTRYYGGTLRDVNGQLIEGHEQRRKRGFRGVPPSRADPPQFESQAAYLKRLGLLLPGEERRLTATDFSPHTLRF